MICLKTVKRFCKEYWLIENYDRAMADNTQTWHCHHRHEIDWALPRKELISVGRYYDVHFSELIFLTPEEHKRLHKAGKEGPWRGKEGPFKDHHHTEETKAKLSATRKGKYQGENHPNYKYHITKEELYDLYIVQDLSIDRIAEMYRCSFSCIRSKLKQYNIEKPGRPHHYKDIDKDLLYKYRVEDKKTLREIAAIFGVYVYTISKRCKQFNIPDPNIPNACSKEFKEIRKKMRQEKLQKRREEHILEVSEELVDKRWRLYEQICRLHFLEYMPMEEVAKRLDIDLCEVNEIFSEYTI